MARRDPLHAAARGRLARALCAATLAVAPLPAAHATICKYVDADGATHYTNVAPEKGWKKVSCSVADDAPRRSSDANGKPAASPSTFPRVEPATQKSRDDMRRKVLNDELTSEERLLAEAREAYGNGAPQPLAEEQNNAERYRQRIERLRQSVQLHERNIEALRKELAATR